MFLSGWELRALFAKEKTAASLRGHLVAHGKVGFDLGLVTRAPALGCGYLAQWRRRLLSKFHTGKPSRFALAEKAAKRAREQGDVV